MKPHFTLTQYRAFDLVSFAVILAVVEGLISFASSRWFPDQLYTVSVTAGVTAIVMIRWKWFGAIHAVIGGLVLCIVFKSTPQQYIIYCVGNLLGLLGILIAKLIKEERMRKNIFLACVYGVSVLLLMQTGRGCMALMLGYGFKNAVAFYATDSLSIVFTAIILLVAGKQDGLLENQVHYIHRIQESEAEDRNSTDN
ncbi:MAG: hypothetical protein IJ796_05485 [Lachnospiraceae bacterium]|nr:hypothetical protein [Lachnospiraceae bacterium]